MGWKGIKPSKYAIQMIENLEEDVKQKVMIGFQTIITMAPVQDGHYRGSHVLTVNGQNFSYDPSHLDVGGNATISKALNSVMQFKLGDTVYIQTNAPHALRLENGWSDQNRDMYAVAYMNIRNA